MSCSITIPIFLSNHCTDDHRGCTSCTTTSNKWVFSTVLSSSVWAVTCLIDLSQSDRYKMNCKVILISISLIAQDVEHFLKCFSALWDASIETSLFNLYLFFSFLSFFFLLQFSSCSSGTFLHCDTIKGHTAYVYITAKRTYGVFRFLTIWQLQHLHFMGWLRDSDKCLPLLVSETEHRSCHTRCGLVVLLIVSARIEGRSEGVGHMLH